MEGKTWLNLRDDFFFVFKFNIIISFTNRTMFWLAWNMEYFIQTASMDGRSPATLISSDLNYPKSLTVDETNSRLYWVSGDKIQSCRFDGSQRVEIHTSGYGSPDAIDIFGDRLFWIDDYNHVITVSFIHD